MLLVRSFARLREGFPAIGLFFLMSSAAYAGVFDDDWRQLDSANFSLITNLPADEAAEQVRSLELFRSVTGVLTGVQLPPLKIPTKVYVFRRLEDFRTIDSGQRRLGYMRPGLDANRLVVAPHELADHNEVAYHEYVHYHLRNATAFHYPRWYDEGMADFLATMTVEADEVIIGAPPSIRLGALNSGSFPGVHKLMSATDRTKWWCWDGDFYATAWALVHYFHFGPTNGMPNRGASLTNYLVALNTGSSHRQAFADTFDVNQRRLEREMFKHLRHLNAQAIPVDRFPHDDSFSASTLSALDTAIELYRLALSKPKHAEKLYRRRLRDDDDPRLMGGLAVSLVAQKEFDEGVALARRAMARAPDNATLKIDLGDMLLAWCDEEKPPAQCPDYLEEARSLYSDALAMNTDRVDALYGLGVAKLALNAPDQAANHLLEVTRQAPWSAWACYYLGESLRRVDRADPARRYLNSAFNWAHDDKSLQRKAAASLALLDDSRQAEGP